MAKLTYKQTTAEHGDHQTALDALYNAVSQGYGISLSEAQGLVDQYLQGKIDIVDLLNDIQNELDWIPGERDNLQNAIDTVIPGLAIPAAAKAVLTGLASNQKRILQEQLRELRTWRFVIKNGKWD